MNGRYYEAILQLRPETKELLDFINEFLAKKEKVFISKKVDLKTGSDIYISSKNFAVSLGRQLKRRFGGTIKITKSLYGTSKLTSKNVYRVTILFRLKKTL